MLNPYPWQKVPWRRLLEAARQDRLPHALLLIGAEGLGIDEFIHALAARLLCEKAAGENPACGECRACLLYHSGNHPDIIRSEPEEPGKAIRVETIRDLIDYTHLSSQYNRYKLAVIDPAEAMNRHAANSLLKTLEEPPSHSIFILNSRNPSQLPVTIRSRCQTVSFPVPPTHTALEWLTEQLQGNADRAAELLIMARNRPLSALHLEEDNSVEKQAALLSDLEHLKAGASDPVATARRWLDLEPGRVMQWLLVFIRIMSGEKLTAVEPATGGGYRKTLRELANELDLLELLKWYDIVLDNYRAATGPFNPNPQGLLEDIIVNWQALSKPRGGINSERNRRT